MKQPPDEADRPPLLEVHQRLEQIVQAYPAARLLVDMARDAATEAARLQAAILSHVRRLRRKRDLQRDEGHRLLDALAESPAILAPKAAVQPEALTEAFALLKRETFPNLARRLYDEAGRGEPRDFQVILVEGILRHGQRPLVEAQLLHVGKDRAALRERLRQHVARRLGKNLVAQTGFRVTPDVGAKIDEVIRRSLTLLDDVLHTNPPARLYWPGPGAPFDPEWHERTGGKPGNEGRMVRGTLFPGLRVFGPTGGPLERAVVATRRPDE